MKKIFLFVFVSLALLTTGAYTQNLIAVQNGGNPSFFSNLDTAIVHSQNGDTIYIPGGNFSLSVPVDKRLHIFGVGHFPDSTLSSGQTRVNGHLNLIGDASNGSFMGVLLNGLILTGGSTTISGYLVQRCRINGLNLNYTSTNWIFVENIIQGYILCLNNPATNCYFYNNIIDAYINHEWNGFTLSTFKNNIFLFLYSGTFLAPIKASYSIFENNIFINSDYACYQINNSAVNNNIFAEGAPLGWCWDCWGANNIVAQPQSSIFINQSGNSFSYNHDYHLQPTSPGKNAGKDGTDIGIYGGAFPWKAGSVPINPHVQFQSVSGVDPTGNIHVVVKVAAQDY